MSSVSDKRTSREYNLRPAVIPGEAYQDFIRQIPDKTLSDEKTQKHSEFKKPYRNDSYQEMDYLGTDLYWPGWPDFPMPVPGIIPPETYPIPGDGPTQYPPPLHLFLKCCSGIYLDVPSKTEAMERSVPLMYGGGRIGCEYRIEFNPGSTGGHLLLPDTNHADNRSTIFLGGTHEEINYFTGYYPGTIKISVTPFMSGFTTDVNKICIEVIISVEGCKDSYISHTTHNMQTGTQQNIGVGNPTVGVAYEWALAGGGTLSDLTGNSTTYTAPATNNGCTGNATITLSVQGAVCDTLYIGVYSASQANNLAGYRCEGHRIRPDSSECYCDFWKYRYKCNGTTMYFEGFYCSQHVNVSSPCPLEVFASLTCNDPIAIYPQDCPNPGCDIFDTRDGAMIEGGCCPDFKYV